MTITELSQTISSLLEPDEVVSLLTVDGTIPTDISQLRVDFPFPGFYGKLQTKDGITSIWDLSQIEDDWQFTMTPTTV